ncbi:MAG: hypothetical protein ACK5HY_09545 [Parahaliea sp.]
MKRLYACLFILLLTVVQTVSAVGDAVVIHSDDNSFSGLVLDHLADEWFVDHAQVDGNDDTTLSPNDHSCHCHGTHFSLPQHATDHQPLAVHFQPCTSYLARRPAGHRTPLLSPPRS